MYKTPSCALEAGFDKWWDGLKADFMEYKNKNNMQHHKSYLERSIVLLVLKSRCCFWSAVEVIYYFILYCIIYKYKQKINSIMNSFEEADS